MSRYIPALLVAAQKLMPHLLDAAKSDFREIILDGQCAAQQVIQAGLDTADSIARSMGTSVVMRRQAWLSRSGFSPDVQATLLDLPFDGTKPFGAKADAAFERFKDTRATAKSLGLQSIQRNYRQFRRFRGFSR